jgi:hypothetical protein
MTNAGSSRTGAAPCAGISISGLNSRERQREMIGVDGPSREHYLVTGFDTDDESRLVTEVGWPVFQTTPTSGATSWN